MSTRLEAPRWPARLDLLQSGTGLALGLFMWVRMFFVSSILLGKDAMWTAVNAAGSHAVLACSALRQAYRDRLASAGDVRFVHLAGDLPTIAKRIETRRHRYMPASLLASQFATLEPPVDAIVIDVRKPLAAQVDAIRAALGDAWGAPR